MKRVLGMPWFALSCALGDISRAMDLAVRRGALGLAWLLLGFAVGYWIYIPLHELMHAFACMALGGEVTELELQRKFGGGLLAQALPWIEPHSEYAGRLSGFDTRGSDGIYLGTTFGPFVMTLLPGVWALRWMARKQRFLGAGCFVPFALAPFVSITGDAYELGSVALTHAQTWGLGDYDILRGDDLLLKAQQLRTAGADGLTWLLYAAAASLGLLWSCATYWAAHRLAQSLGQPPLGEPRGEHPAA